MQKKNFSPEEALSRLEARCAACEMCVSEVVAKLNSWGIYGTDAEAVVDRLKNAGHIDEYRYARAFVNDKSKFSKWGKTKIKQSLSAKRIPSEYIESAFADFDYDRESTTLYDLLSKKSKTFKPGTKSYDAFAKLVRFGVSRGFDYSTVYSAAKKLCLRNDEFEE